MPKMPPGPRQNALLLWFVLLLGCYSPLPLCAQSPSPRTAALSPAPTRTKIILDTDIGDDVDDAFALALALCSPELEIVGITTAWGDTPLRARLVDRFLAETNHASAGITVAEGIRTQSKSPFTQARWAQAGPPAQTHAQAVDFLLRQIRESPGGITLVAIGPLTNIGAAIDRDADAFRGLKRVVLMGGSIRRRYNDLGYAPDRGPEPEYNILSDIPAAQKLFASGVPIFMMPLDSTQLKLDEVKRAVLFSAGTLLTNSLAALYYQWGQQTPTLFQKLRRFLVESHALQSFFRVQIKGRELRRQKPRRKGADLICRQVERDITGERIRLSAPGFKFGSDDRADGGNFRRERHVQLASGLDIILSTEMHLFVAHE